MSPFVKKIVASTYSADCGHETLANDIVEAFGERREMKIPIKDGKTPFCHRCLEKMTIRCARCGKAIFIGDPITFYTPSKNDFKISDYGVIVGIKPLQLVGCLRMICVDSRADRVGFWYPPGRVERVLTPLELAMQNSWFAHYNHKKVNAL